MFCLDSDFSMYSLFSFFLYFYSELLVCLVILNFFNFCLLNIWLCTLISDLFFYLPNFGVF